MEFDGPSSKYCIPGYNHCRNPKLGLKELYGNTVLLKGQSIWQNHLWDIQDQEGCIFDTHCTC